MLGEVAEMGLNMAARTESDPKAYAVTMHSVRLTVALQAYIAHGGSVSAALAASRRARVDGVAAHLLPTEDDFRQLKAEFEADMREDLDDEDLDDDV